jgi:hypothetical protein
MEQTAHVCLLARDPKDRERALAAVDAAIQAGNPTYEKVRVYFDLLGPGFGDPDPAGSADRLGPPAPGGAAAEDPPEPAAAPRDAGAADPFGLAAYDELCGNWEKKDEDG